MKKMNENMQAIFAASIIIITSIIIWGGVMIFSDITVNKEVNVDEKVVSRIILKDMNVIDGKSFYIVEVDGLEYLTQRSGGFIKIE